MNERGKETGEWRNIRLLIAYDGTEFSGWQRQEGSRTVQGLIEGALAKMHKKPVSLTGSGRTDAGVHAAGQVANFYTDIRSIAPERFTPALNSLLPQDVRILQAQEAVSGFHARFDALSRTYRYQLLCARQGLPHERRYALQRWRHPSVALLNEYTLLLRGELDCSVFASPRDPSVSRTRYIFGSSFFVQGELLIFEITANAFLWKMVRSIVGTLLHYEEQGRSPAAFSRLLASGDHALAGPTAPPQGLFLWHIRLPALC
jgi:tRNA pseudouridine38-40 synthase